MGTALAVLLACVPPVAASGQQSSIDVPETNGASTFVRPVFTASTLTGPIVIDGRIDEAAWLAVEPASGFIQGTPVEGIPAEQDTEVWLLIGEDAIYFAARMYEADPRVIDRRLVRRDEDGTYDYVSLSLDPNLDRRTGYNFRVSAANVQLDQYFYNDTRPDRNWDAVWESAVQHDEHGWTAEVRIPLSQIRYESTEGPQTWGVNFARRRMVTNETSYYALRSRTREGFVNQFGTMENVRVPKPSRRIEVRPYVVSSLHRGPAEAGDPFFDGTDAASRTGADLRVGLGSAFTVDATFNPDFGQVEADPAEINLTDFETRFQERRPFFVEDGQIFDFSLGRGMRGDDLFYSRRIGRSPQGDAPSGADYENMPTDATILGAAKVTGRTQSGFSMGVLAAVTDSEHGDAYYLSDGSFEEFLAEPRAQYGVVRAQQDFNDGASQVSGIATAIDRSLPGDGAFDFLSSSAYSGGLNFEHQWSDRRWALGGSFAGTRVQGDSVALIRLQRSSNHYFHRPDATRYGVDSTATAMNGAQWRLQLDRQNGFHWTGGLWLGQTTPGFEVNDLGYSRGSESLESGVNVNYREIRPGSWYKSYNVRGSVSANWSHEALDRTAWSSWEDARTGGTANVNVRTTFINDWDGDINVMLSPDHRNFGLTRGGPVMEDPGSINVRANLNTDERKLLYLRTGFNRRFGFDDSGDQLSVNATVRLRPSPQLEIEMGPRFSASSSSQQYVGSTSTLPYAPTYDRRYLFGDIEQRSVEMETRVNWTFSPKLSFQLYAQPLLSSGDYVAYKQLSAPRSYDFDVFAEGTWADAAGVDTCVGGRICSEIEADGDVRQHIDFDGDGIADYSFRDRDFNVRSLVGNAVLRWEYRPGSTIFVVWQRRQAGRVGYGDFDFGRDAGALFDAPADNRFMVKVSYWLGL